MVKTITIVNNSNEIQKVSGHESFKPKETRQVTPCEAIRFLRCSHFSEVKKEKPAPIKTTKSNT